VVAGAARRGRTVRSLRDRIVRSFSRERE